MLTITPSMRSKRPETITLGSIAALPRVSIAGSEVRKFPELFWLKIVQICGNVELATSAKPSDATRAGKSEALRSTVKAAL